MSSPLSLKLRTRPVPTPLVLTPLPFSPDYSSVWAHKMMMTSSSELTATATPLTTARTDKTLTPFSVSAYSAQSSASVYSCDSYSSVEDWSEISQLSSQTTGIPCEYLIQGLGSSFYASDHDHPYHHHYANQTTNWAEVQEVINRPRMAALSKPPPPHPVVPNTRDYVRKLRSRSIAALQLEGHKIHPIAKDAPSIQNPLQTRTRRVRSEAITIHKSSSNTLIPPPPPLGDGSQALKAPMFTPSIFLNPSPDGHDGGGDSRHRASVNANFNHSNHSHPPLFTPSVLLSSPGDGDGDGGGGGDGDGGGDSTPLGARVSRWERPKRSVSTRDRSGSSGNGGGVGMLALLPSLPKYVPIEGLDTKQDEKLKVKGLRSGLVFTVARMRVPAVSPLSM